MAPLEVMNSCARLSNASVVTPGCTWLVIKSKVSAHKRPARRIPSKSAAVCNVIRSLLTRRAVFESDLFITLSLISKEVTESTRANFCAAQCPPMRYHNHNKNFQLLELEHHEMPNRKQDQYHQPRKKPHNPCAAQCKA